MDMARKGILDPLKFEAYAIHQTSRHTNIILCLRHIQTYTRRCATLRIYLRPGFEVTISVFIIDYSKCMWIATGVVIVLMHIHRLHNETTKNNKQIQSINQLAIYSTSRLLRRTEPSHGFESTKKPSTSISHLRKIMQSH